jgi:hypothetical protein
MKKIVLVLLYSALGIGCGGAMQVAPVTAVASQITLTCPQGQVLVGCSSTSGVANSQMNISMFVGSLDIPVTIYDRQGQVMSSNTNEVLWGPSSDEAVAFINGAGGEVLLTAKSFGTAQMIGRIGKASATLNVTVQ